MPGNTPRPINAPWAPKRLSILYGLFVLLSGVLLVRVLDLGVIHGEEYAQQARRNYLITRTVDAPRGTIHDRHGEQLAFNRATFAVSMSRGSLTTETVKSSLDRLGELLAADFSDQLDPIVALRPRWRSTLLSRRLTLDQVTAVLERRYVLPGVSVEPRFQRYYPHRSTLCHVLGHTGKITPEMWKREDRKYQREGHEIDDEIGICGVEALYEDALRGQKGLEQVYQSGRGRVLRTRMDSRCPTIPGDRLRLTIDLELQRLAETLLLDQEGAILAVDPRNGEMLVWASVPGFDLNAPAAIDAPTSQPRVNRAIQEHYRPGSTFKVLTALAALEAGWDPNRIVTCRGAFRLPDWRRPYTCLGRHGPVDLRRALKYSCNIYFYTMADYLYALEDSAGYRLVSTASHYGLGSPTRVGLSVTGMRASGFDEVAGNLPTRPQLRRERGSVLHLAIGQGRIDVTPLQMLMAYATLANGGERLVPQLIHERRTAEDRLVFASDKYVLGDVRLLPEHRQAIIDGLRAACGEPGGTAAKAGFRPEWNVAGKTSTAEHDADVLPDAWFIGFAPADNPEIVVLVMIEHGGGGGEVAAPLAARLFERYFDRKAHPQAIAAR